MVLVVLLSTMNAHINCFIRSYSNTPPLPVVGLEEFHDCLVARLCKETDWSVRAALQLCCKAVLTPANLMVNPLVQWWATAKKTWSGFRKFTLKKHHSNGDVLGDALVSKSFPRRVLREIEPGGGGDLNFRKFPYYFTQIHYYFIQFSFRFNFETIQFW